MARKINDSIDLAFNEVQNVVAQNLAADPGTGVVDGRFYYSTGLNALRLRAGGSWTTLASGAGYSDEQAQDAINTLLTGGTHTGGLGFTYDDTGNTLSLTLSNNEAFQDIVGAFLPSGAGSTGLTVTYDDAGGKMNYVVTDSPLLGGSSLATVLARGSHTGTQAPATILFSATDKLLGRDTASGGAGEEIGVTGGLVFDGAGNIQTAAFTGDVTKTLGGTALTIAANAVVTSHILNSNVTLAKLANIATDSLIGRDTAASGVPENILLNATLVMDGSLNLGRAALTGDVTAPAGSNATTIGASKVLTTMILDANVTNAKLADMVQATFKGRAAAAGTGVPTDLTAAQAKTALAIANTDVSGLGSLATVSNLTGNVTSVGAATTIPAGTVTNAMQANAAATSIKGNNTGAPAAPMDLTYAQVKTALAYNGTEIVFTPAGNIAATNVSAAITELETDMTALISATVQAQTWKDPVDAATTGALPSLTYSSGPGTLTATANAALAAQDGVTLAVGDDLLVKDQASTFQDGIYTVTQVGSGAAPFILTRRADANTATELRDAAVMIEGGTTLGGDIYTQTNASLADLTAAAQTWVKTGDTNTVYTADGTTLELVGNSFRIKATAAGAGLTGGGGAALDVAAGTGLEISSDTVRIAAAAAGNGLTGGAGSALAVGAGTGVTVNADDVAVNHAIVPMLYAGAVTGGATSEVITHNLGTRDVHVQVYLAAGTFAEEDFTVEHTSTTTVTIRSAITIPGSTYRVVVFG